MMAEDPRSDADLVSDARQGDHGAWAALGRRHGPRLAAYLGARLRRPEIVDNLVGETLVATWLRLGDLADPAGFAAWFRKSGAGLALKWAREHPDAAIEATIPASRLPVRQAESIGRLDRLIGELDEAHRMAIELRWRAGMTGESLGIAMRCPAETAERLADEAEEQVLRVWDA
jgi:DNA-directed RNA polymerase specialized sigma24 family protein